VHLGFCLGKWKTRDELVKRSWKSNNKMGLRWDGTVCGLDSTELRIGKNFGQSNDLSYPIKREEFLDKLPSL